MTSLVVMSHDGKTLSPQMWHVASALLMIDAQYDGIIMGVDVMPIAEQAKQLPGLRKLLVVQHATLQHGLAESVVPTLAESIEPYRNIIFASNTTTKNILPRLAVCLNISPITDVCAVVDENTFKRPIYAGNAIATVHTEQKKRLLSIRTASFVRADTVEHTSTDVQMVVLDWQTQKLSEFLGLAASDSDKPDLASAKIVVSGGRGIGSAKDFALVESLADSLGAAVGASRAAVDAGFVPNDYQVGQTGKIIAPDIYIALGISGAVQHLAGMKDSRVIIAVDKDPDAPIFKVADYGMVGDVFEVVPALIQQLNKK